MKIILAGFAGAVQAIQSKLLPDSVGVDSRNQKPGRGDLRPWRNPTTVATVPSGRKTIYRMGRDVASDSVYWLSWSTIVHAVRGFIASDTTERTYFTGSDVPRVTDNTTGLASAPYPTTSRLLGVPNPPVAVSLLQTLAGSGTDDETRYYVHTFVTDRGEESKPSAVAAIVCKPGAHIQIGNLNTPPTGNYGITVRRIYRTVVGASSEADYFLIIEQASSITTANDNALSPTATVLKSNGPSDAEGRAWDMPPADGKHLTGMWNGMMALISGRSVRVCEAFRPHAWPVAYEILPPDVTPVALAVWDKNLLVMTTGRPSVVSGSIPSALGDEPLTFKQACVSERSPAVVGDGVVWAAPDGLVYYGSRGPQLLTAGIMLREDWQALKPETIIGCCYEGVYMGMYEPTTGVRKAFLVDPMDPQGIYFLDVGYQGAFFDDLQDQLYLLDGTAVKKWDAGTTFMTASFKSKVFRAPRPLNMACMEVTADAFPVTVTITAKWIDTQGGEHTSTEIRTINSTEPVMLKAGFLATDWQVEVSTAGSVQGVVLAETMRELRET